MTNFQHLKFTAHEDMRDLTDGTDGQTHERTTVCLRCIVHRGIITSMRMVEFYGFSIKPRPPTLDKDGQPEHLLVYCTCTVCVDLAVQ